jgi:hypothetical protein
MIRLFVETLKICSAKGRKTRKKTRGSLNNRQMINQTMCQLLCTASLSSNMDIHDSPHLFVANAASLHWPKFLRILATISSQITRMAQQ